MKDLKPKVCRVCLQSVEQYTSLLERLGEMKIYEHVMSVAMVNITPYDGLPDCICPTCLLQLQTVISFKIRCEESDHVLRQGQSISKQETGQFQLPDIKEEVDLELAPKIDNEVDDYGSATWEVSQETNPDIDDCKHTIPAPAKGQKYPPQCNDCGEFFRSKCKLRVHWKKEHIHLSYMCCQHCKRIFKSKEAYDRHERVMQCSDLKKNGDKVLIVGEGKSRIFQCRHCEYNTKHYRHMRTHFVVHTPGEKPYQCKICSKAFTQAGSLNTHVVAHHDTSKQPTCYICGKIVKSKQHLCRHMKVHEDIRIPCSVCMKTFKSKHALKVHQKRHLDKKDYQCEVCPETFYSASELCNHRKTHYQIKCKFCEFQCARKRQMHKHELQHGGIKQIVCVKCGRFYESLPLLNFHLRKYHQPKTVQCPDCPKIFSTQKILRYHKKRHHEITLSSSVVAKLEPNALCLAVNEQSNECV